MPQTAQEVGNGGCGQSVTASLWHSFLCVLFSLLRCGSSPHRLQVLQDKPAPACGPPQAAGVDICSVVVSPWAAGQFSLQHGLSMDCMGFLLGCLEYLLCGMLAGLCFYTFPLAARQCFALSYAHLFLLYPAVDLLEPQRGWPCSPLLPGHGHWHFK